MKNLKETCSEKLALLSTNIDASDKLEAKRKLNLSMPTIDKYLSGDIIKIDTAVKLIGFFTRIVKKRTKDLQRAAA